jgi:uncharacterized MAPEG superfamily protein
MTTPLFCLMGFGFWTVFLVPASGGGRGGLVVGGRATASSFPAGQPHGSDRYWRLNRAHLNCVENLPLFAAVVLTGHVTGLADGTFATLAQVYIGARVAQTLIHVASGSAMAVNLRFACFATQVGCLLTMANAIVSR